MGSACHPVRPFVRLNEGEIPGFDLSPDAFMPSIRFERMVELTQRNKIIWAMRSTERYRFYMMSMKFKTGRATGDLTSIPVR
jgi:hypothetical protein